MTPQDIQNKRFDKGMGGYKVDDVNAYLAEVAEYIAQLEEEKTELEQKMMVIAEKLEEYREDEESLRAALIGAQKLGDSVVRDAKKKAEAILAEANAKAREIVEDAKGSMDRETIAFTKMQADITNFKAQILELYRRQIELIEKGNVETKTPLSVTRAMRNLPKEPAPQAEPEKDEFTIKFEEAPAPAPLGEPPATSHKPHKRQNYGELRFGEEYNLTRKD